MTRRPLAHFSRQKLETTLDHLRCLTEADQGHACTCGRPHIDGQARADRIARIERELELRDLWEEGR